MKFRSLRFRLLAASIVSIIVALLITGISLVAMFRYHVERRIGLELETYLNQVTASVGVADSGRITFDMELADPRFKQPLSGLYWQVQDEGRPTLLRSRSLWDSSIELPKDELSRGVIHEHVLPGPHDQVLLVRERQVTFQADTEERLIRIAIAADMQNVTNARNAFAADMLPYLVVMALVLLAAAWLQIRIGLAPLDAMRWGVIGIRKGAQKRLEPSYPDEVMPLVEEVNGLLDARDQSIKRARAWTTDLAHGLKTPLMALTADAQRLRQHGNDAIADDLDQLSEAMSKRVDRELIRARIRSSVSQTHIQTDAVAIIRRLVRTLERTPLGAKLEWSVDNAGKSIVLILEEDLTELLGNILENASKWAKNKVSILVSGGGNTLSINISDDGPGVPQDQLDKLSLRGVRLDQQRPGSGLGLAIAQDIVEAYKGALSFGRATHGGLSVTVTLPAET